MFLVTGAALHRQLRHWRSRINAQTSSALAFAGIVVLMLSILALVIFLIRTRRRQTREAQEQLAQLGFVMEAKPDIELKKAAFAAIGAPAALRHGHSKIKWVGVAEINGRRVTIAEHSFTIHTGNSSVTIRHICAGVACGVRLGTATIAPRNAVGRWFSERLGLTVKPARWQREIALRFVLDPVRFPRVAEALATDEAQAALALLPKGTSLHLADGVVALARRADVRADVIQPLLQQALRFADILAPDDQAAGEAQPDRA